MPRSSTRRPPEHLGDAEVHELQDAASYGDDARLREAEAWTDGGKPERAAALLATLPDLFPGGDMR